MAVLREMPTIQYSAWHTWLSVYKLFTSCIRQGLVSRDSIVHGEWLPDVSISAWLSTRIGHHRKFGEVPCTECTGQEMISY